MSFLKYRIAFGCFFISLCLFGGAGNLLTCWYMFIKKNKCHLSLASLLVADTVACLISLPIHSFRMFRQSWINSCHIEAVAFYVTIMAVWVSSLSICIIAFDRYTLLTKYQRYDQIMKKRNVKIVLAVVWLVSVVGPAFKFIGGPQVFGPMNGAMLVVPVIFLPIFYYRIVKHVRKNDRTMKTHVPQLVINQKETSSTSFSTSSNNNTNTTTTNSSCNTDNKSTSGNNNNSNNNQSNATARRSREKKVMRRSTLLIGWFFLCSCTCTAFMVLLMMNRQRKFLSPFLVHLLSRFSYLGLVMNSCFNPVIYFLRDAKYRRTLKELFCC